MRAQFFLGKSDPTPPQAGGSEPAKKRKNWFGTVLVILLILALLGGLVYVSKLYWDTQHQLQSLQKMAASDVNNLTPSEVQVLVDEVGHHIVLPNEKPQVVTITNVDQLKINQPFFDVAKNGDKLLVYTTKVILYRTSIDKVIDIAQIRPPTNTPTPSATSSAEKTITPKVSPTKIPVTPTPTI